LADSVDEIYGSGGSVAFDGTQRIRSLEKVGKVQDTLIFEYELVSPESRLLDASGSLERQFEGGSARYQVNVTAMKDSWRVTSAIRLAS